MGMEASVILHSGKPNCVKKKGKEEKKIKWMKGMERKERKKGKKKREETFG